MYNLETYTKKRGFDTINFWLKKNYPTAFEANLSVLLLVCEETQSRSFLPSQ